MIPSSYEMASSESDLLFRNITLMKEKIISTSLLIHKYKDKTSEVKGLQSKLRALTSTLESSEKTCRLLKKKVSEITCEFQILSAKHKDSLEIMGSLKSENVILQDRLTVNEKELEQYKSLVTSLKGETEQHKDEMKILKETSKKQNKELSCYKKRLAKSKSSKKLRRETKIISSSDSDTEFEAIGSPTENTDAFDGNPYSEGSRKSDQDFEVADETSVNTALNSKTFDEPKKTQVITEMKGVSKSFTKRKIRECIGDEARICESVPNHHKVRRTPIKDPLWQELEALDKRGDNSIEECRGTLLNEFVISSKELGPEPPKPDSLIRNEGLEISSHSKSVLEDFHYNATNSTPDIDFDEHLVSCDLALSDCTDDDSSEIDLADNLVKQDANEPILESSETIFSCPQTNIENSTSKSDSKTTKLSPDVLPQSCGFESEALNQTYEPSCFDQEASLSNSVSENIDLVATPTPCSDGESESIDLNSKAKLSASLGAENNFPKSSESLPEDAGSTIDIVSNNFCPATLDDKVPNVASLESDSQKSARIADANDSTHTTNPSDSASLILDVESSNLCPTTLDDKVPSVANLNSDLPSPIETDDVESRDLCHTTLDDQVPSVANLDSDLPSPIETDDVDNSKSTSDSAGLILDLESRDLCPTTLDEQVPSVANLDSDLPSPIETDDVESRDLCHTTLDDKVPSVANLDSDLPSPIEMDDVDISKSASDSAGLILDLESRDLCPTKLDDKDPYVANVNSDLPLSLEKDDADYSNCTAMKGTTKSSCLFLSPGKQKGPVMSASEGPTNSSALTPSSLVCDETPNTQRKSTPSNYKNIKTIRSKIKPQTSLSRSSWIPSRVNSFRKTLVNRNTDFKSLIKFVPSSDTLVNDEALDLVNECEPALSPKDKKVHKNAADPQITNDQMETRDKQGHINNSLNFGEDIEHIFSEVKAPDLIERIVSPVPFLGYEHVEVSSKGSRAGQHQEVNDTAVGKCSLEQPVPDAELNTAKSNTSLTWSHELLIIDSNETMTDVSKEIVSFPAHDNNFIFKNNNNVNDSVKLPRNLNTSLQSSIMSSSEEEEEDGDVIQDDNFIFHLSLDDIIEVQDNFDPLLRSRERCASKKNCLFIYNTSSCKFEIPYILLGNMRKERTYLDNEQILHVKQCYQYYSRKCDYRFHLFGKLQNINLKKIWRHSGHISAPCESAFSTPSLRKTGASKNSSSILDSPCYEKASASAEPKLPDYHREHDKLQSIQIEGLSSGGALLTPIARSCSNEKIVKPLENSAVAQSVPVKLKQLSPKGDCLKPDSCNDLSEPSETSSTSIASEGDDSRVSPVKKKIKKEIATSKYSLNPKCLEKKLLKTNSIENDKPTINVKPHSALVDELMREKYVELFGAVSPVKKRKHHATEGISVVAKKVCTEPAVPVRGIAEDFSQTMDSYMEDQESPDSPEMNFTEQDSSVSIPLIPPHQKSDLLNSKTRMLLNQNVCEDELSSTLQQLMAVAFPTNSMWDKALDIANEFISRFSSQLLLRWLIHYCSHLIHENLTPSLDSLAPYYNEPCVPVLQKKVLYLLHLLEKHRPCIMKEFLKSCQFMLFDRKTGEKEMLWLVRCCIALFRSQGRMRGAHMFLKEVNVKYYKKFELIMCHCLTVWPQLLDQESPLRKSIEYVMMCESSSPNCHHSSFLCVLKDHYKMCLKTISLEECLSYLLFVMAEENCKHLRMEAMLSVLFISRYQPIGWTEDVLISKLITPMLEDFHNDLISDGVCQALVRSIGMVGEQYSSSIQNAENFFSPIEKVLRKIKGTSSIIGEAVMESFISLAGCDSQRTLNGIDQCMKDFPQHSEIMNAGTNFKKTL